AGVVIFAVVLVLIVAGAQFALWLTMASFHAEEQKTAALRPPLFDDSAGLYPPPRLQDNPARDMPGLVKSTHARLDSYGWVDPGKAAHIPTARPMDLLVEHGTPKAPPQPKPETGEPATPPAPEGTQKPPG